MIDGEEGLLFKRAKAPRDKVFVGKLLQIVLNLKKYIKFKKIKYSK